MWRRIFGAVGGAILGMALGAAVPLFLFGLLILVGDIAASVRAENMDASQRLLFMATACAIAITCREALIWLLRGQDNDKRKFFKRTAAGLGVGVLLLGAIGAIVIVFAYSRLAEYRDGPFVYNPVLSCAIAGALAAGLLRLLEAPHDGPGAIAASGRFKAYAGRVGLVFGLGALMGLSYCLVSPVGRWAALGLLRNEPFAEGMPVSFWRHRLEGSDKQAQTKADDALRRWEEEKAPHQRVRPRFLSGRNEQVHAALGLDNVEQRDAALLALTKDPDSSNRADAIVAMAAAEPPRVAALTEVLKSEDLFTRDRAAEALAQIGPEARPAVPALLELWWRSYGGSLVEVADDIESLDPGALKVARIERYMTGSAIAGILIALPVVGVLLVLSRARRAEIDRQARWNAQPNPFEPMAETNQAPPQSGRANDGPQPAP
jgi:hypothetical protein